MENNLEKYEQALNVAKEELYELEAGKRFLMCIPAKDNDSDVIFSNALEALELAIMDIKSLQDQLNLVVNQISQINQNNQIKVEDVPSYT